MKKTSGTFSRMGSVSTKISGARIFLLGLLIYALILNFNWLIHSFHGVFGEGGSLSELLNGVATVLKDTLLTVDERDPGDAVDSVHVGWVI